jgi:uncharacterized protein
MQFEWDAAKAAANEVKHDVSFAFAARVFDNVGCVEVDASRADDGEPRRKCIGAVDGRLFVVVFHMREDVCRIISARRADSNEDKTYYAHRP